MTSDAAFTDDALWTGLRDMYAAADPVPAGLATDVIVAVAAADLDREYALLALVDSDAVAAVRGDADMLTLQFGDGTTSVLVHVTADSDGRRRLDGWVDGEATDAQLITGDVAQTAPVVEGRFAFEDVGSGVVRLRFALAADDSGRGAELLTPRFEL
ncbi:hypothetical protein [Microbacterium telephonicum]|uniref:Uncharacterized protein n=1 Tax=Microbacterium telephonicum TaxID=1714841 RepID=A0A498BWR3_9MICO|nr:hypothetical protein [Microbacterium telephonicum]RLK48094.1 hypothetical protein C7474_2697 [Microbacterium telephonicum]